jgi:glycosyltransferase involved in cell wall biosynthesis
LTSNKPISVLFVIDGIEFGGGERVFLQLIQGMPRSRFTVQVATSHGDFFETLKRLGVIVHPIDFGVKVSFRNIYILSKIIRDNQVDIVSSQGARTEFYARLGAKLFPSNAMVVSTIATPVEGYDTGLLKKSIYLFFDRFSDKYVDRFIVVSEMLKKRLITVRRIPADRVVKIYNGIELDEYDPAVVKKEALTIRREYNIRDTDYLIGAIGRMVWQKGFEYLLRGANDFLRPARNVKVLMVGDGPYREDLQEYAVAAGLGDKIVFAGFRRDIRNILSVIDLFVIPSLQEGFPMVTLEAMAMAKPIVATRIDGITEQITDGVEGILVPPKDPSALAQAISKIIDNKELALSFGAAARKRVEREFTVEKMVTETADLFSSLFD